MRVFLDTNVLVSAVATRGLCADVVQLVLSEHELVTGETVLAELGHTLHKKFRLSADIIDETDEFLRREASVASGEALTATADIFVTGDGDLLDVAKDAPLPIVTPRDFWHHLRSESGSSR